MRRLPAIGARQSWVITCAAKRTKWARAWVEGAEEHCTGVGKPDRDVEEAGLPADDLEGELGDAVAGQHVGTAEFELGEAGRRGLGRGGGVGREISLVDGVGAACAIAEDGDDALAGEGDHLGHCAEEAGRAEDGGGHGGRPPREGVDDALVSLGIVHVTRGVAADEGDVDEAPHARPPPLAWLLPAARCSPGRRPACRVCGRQGAMG